MSARPRLPRIWIITDPEHPDGPALPIVRALRGCPAGVVGVQLRAKSASDRQLVSWGRELRAATRDHGALLTVNRRVDVAQIVDADGVHLPELGLPPDRILHQWPEIPLIGVSRHDREGLVCAADEGASFAFLSPVFDVPEKGAPMGIEGFGLAIAGVGIPTYALGGLSAEVVERLMAAGAHGVAVRRAIYGAEDPQTALADLLRALDKNRDNGD